MNQVMDISFYPTVSELLNLPIFKDCKLLAGHSGLGKVVTGFNLSDTPEYYKWLCESEILITTCFAIHKDSSAISSFIPHVAEKMMAGIFVKFSQYLGTVPPIMTDQADSLGIPLIELPPGIRFADITKAISDELLKRQTALLQKILSFNKMLTGTIIEGADLNDIARMISNLINSSVMILDTVNNRRAVYIAPESSASFSGLSEEAAIQTLISGSRSHELNVGNCSFGYLYLYGKDLATYLDADMLVQILHTIPLEITREQSIRATRNDGFSSFLLHLFSDQIVDEDWEAARASKLGLNAEEAHILLQIMVLERDHGTDNSGLFQRSMLINSITSLFTNLGLSVRAVNSPDKYIILLSTPQNNQALAHLSTHLSNMAAIMKTNYPALKITAGCGRPHTGISGIIQSNREAGIALRASKNCNQNLLCFEDLGILRLIYADNPDYEINAYITETLGDLTDKNQNRNTELLRTLECYLEQHGNIRRVSEKLFTHYNTISYRLKNIEEITGVDLRDSQKRFQLELALNLYHATTPVP